MTQHGSSHDVKRGRAPYGGMAFSAGRLTYVLIVFLLVSALRAQDVRVEVASQDPPHYVGEPVVIQFTADGFDEQPEPTCAIDTQSGQLADGLRGQMGGINPSVFSQIIQRNGQLFQSKRVTFQIQYLITADQAGDYQVGPFVIQQGNKQAHVDAVSMSFQTVPLDPAMQVRLTLPDKPVYPDQRVPVTIEWCYAEDFDNVLKLSIYSPLFDEFRFALDPPPSRRGAELPIDTKDGRVSLAATVQERQIDGRRFEVVSATRTLVPDRVGEFTVGPIAATLRRATEWAKSRSPFGDFDDAFGGSLLREMMQGQGRRPARTALVRAVGQPLKLIVNPFPLAGRPESFAGAVGKGFSIEVAADRTVVRVGDPIGLDITLRGDGNIDNASLPTLSADRGMDPKRFRLPEGDVPGTLSDSSKRFHVSVRVADESVSEIPAIAYSWFDPETETYQTAHSKPIALRVMPAQIVSAKDVVSNDQSTGPVAGTNDAKGTNSTNGGPGETSRSSSSPPGFSLNGADLAIEQDPLLLLSDSRGLFGNSIIVSTAIYAAGFLLIAIVLIDRKRRSVDPAIVARRKTLRRQQARIAHAAGKPKRQAAEEIAAALRILIAEVTDVDRNRAQAVVAECEAIVYAPGDAGDARLDEALIERAKRITEHLK